MKMKKYLFSFLLVLFSINAFSHSSHYKGIKKIEMDILRNGEIIGYNNFFFKKSKNGISVKTYTNFKVELFGISVFSILSEAEEIYENDKLIYFKSNTFQNNKEKYVNLNYNKSLKKFIIDGSSYKGEASEDSIVGNWWNHKMFKATKQISPLSGSIKEQIVTFVGKDIIIINDKKYLTEHFNIKNKDKNLPEDRRFNFNVWYDPKNNIIIKVAYNKMGNWEYRLKNFE